MFERFTERARQAVVLAQDEARELRHSHIGSEHLLLGLLEEEEGLAARAFASFDVSVERARAEVVRRVGFVEGPPTSGEMPFTPRAKRVLERSLQEALALGHNYVGTEHLLLAIVSLDESMAMNVLQDLGVDRGKLRDTVIELLSGGGAPAHPRSRQRSSRRRAARALSVERSVLEGGFRVEPDGEVIGLLMGAAARALENGRTEMTVADLLIALSRGERTGALLSELGAGEAAIRAALERRGASDEPPEAAAGS